MASQPALSAADQAAAVHPTLSNFLLERLPVAAM